MGHLSGSYTACGTLAPMFVLLLLSFLVSPEARATSEQSLQLQMRYAARTTERNLVEPAILYERILTPWLSAGVGSKPGFTTGGLVEWGYQGGVKFHAGEWVSFQVRLNHRSLIQDQLGVTDLL